MSAEPSPSLHLAVYDRMADWQYGHVIAQVRSGLGPNRAGSLGVHTVGLTGAPVTTMGGPRFRQGSSPAALGPCRRR